MIYRIILFCFSFVLFNNVYAQIDSTMTFERADSIMTKIIVQDEIKTNDEIVGELITKNLEELANILSYDAYDNSLYFELDGVDKSVLNFFTGKFRGALRDYKLRLTRETVIDPEIDRKLVIRNLKVQTKYPQYGSIGVLGNKRFIRIIKVSFDVDYGFISKNETIYTAKITDEYKDEIDVSAKEKIENKNYSFLNSTLPEDSFFNKYLVPAGLILISAVTIVLFFVIRSN